MSRSLLRIVSYLPVVDSSTWNFHVRIFVTLNSGKQKYMFTFSEVVNFPYWVSQVVSAVSFYLIIEVNLPIKIVELLPLFNSIRKFLNFAFLLRLFILHCKIGE